jgi:urease accessory protein
MSDAESLLAVLQGADSFFPSGAISLSSGLEGLIQDQIVKTENDVERFVSGQLHSRWAVFDRGVVVESARRSSDLQSLTAIDRIVEAQTLCNSARDGSKRTGRALLGVHAKMGTPLAAEYESMIHSDSAIGHNAVMQGMVWRLSGAKVDQIELMSAHSFMVGLTGAALRLGIIGHIGAQSIIRRCQAQVQTLVSESAPDIRALSSFTPQQEIAMMRHENMSNRLFIN